jgi:glycine betaine catabolism B
MKLEAKVQKVIWRSTDVVSTRFPKPIGFSYKPGQYMMVTLNVSGKPVAKSFTLSSSPTEPFLEFTKRLTDSEYSTALKAVKFGDSFWLEAPYGIFTFMGEYPKVAFLAGGIGITPFRSICKYCTDTHQTSNITLFYGCKNEKDMTFKEEFEAIQQKNPNIKVVFVAAEADSNWKGKKGFINAELIKAEAPDFAERMFYACGPPPMVSAMQKLIADLGLPQNQLKLEALAGHI